MMISKASMNDLKNEVQLIRNRFPTLKDDSAFIFWFLHAYLIEKEEKIKAALTGKEGGQGGEKNIDAIYIDDKAEQCNIIQGKFHLKEKTAEKRNDVLTFAELALIPWESKEVIESFFKQLDPIAATKFKDVMSQVKKKKYKLNLYYVTTGKCTQTIIDEVKYKVRKAQGAADIHVFTFDRVMNIYKNYIEGIAPAVPTMKLKIISDGSVHHEGMVHRFDPRTRIESWVFSMSGKNVGDMFSRSGIRLFAKNIRGYLGQTDINKSMEQTIEKEPNNFWYYNNGITLVCDNAKREVEANEDILIVDGAQVINGQQTTRTLESNRANDTNVLVKVIKIPRNHEDDIAYDQLVNSIVRATNWQNHISSSDLISNDYIQVLLEREFRKKGYQYIRKKMNKSEARSMFGHGFFQIDKRELAQAVGACLFDPLVVRKGKEGLFEDSYYKSIFSSHEIGYYLSKYWLMKQIQQVSKGHPERAYAKWLVQNFLWSVLKNVLEPRSMEKKFRYVCERRDREALKPLHGGIEHVFKAVRKYYHKNKKVGKSVKDISSFFQISKLDKGFREYWESRENAPRIKVESLFAKFSAVLSKIETE